MTCVATVFVGGVFSNGVRKSMSECVLCGKREKTRFNAFTANADGSEILDPLIIGHAQRPRCFKRKSGKALGFDYWWNKKAWMAGSIFDG